MLPSDFTIRMKQLLGDEYEDYLKSLEGPMHKALRLNPLKAEKAQLLELCEETFGHIFDRVPWEDKGLYYPSDGDVRPGSHPLHEAGAYYIQEPSAMKPVTLLDIKPGEKVLDLCAAPGGKSTQIAAYLMGKGLLVANEPVAKRAGILSSNIERMGIKNAVVLNEMPDKLADLFPAFFDKILVDAPCSGEGMFRKNEEEALREWSAENVLMCAKRQAQIMKSASSMLAPGGLMVYSTCTFSREEDEELIDSFLADNTGFKLISSEKLFPHRVRGEGHFMALLKKEGSHVTSKSGGGRENKSKGREAYYDAFYGFMDELIKDGELEEARNPDFLTFFGDNLYLKPEGCPDLKGLKVERAGLQLGTFKKDGRGCVRFEPAHALALYLKPDGVDRAVDITIEQAASYIEGLTIDISGGDGADSIGNGWILVSVKGISLGWGKLVNGVVKNHYPKGLRRRFDHGQ